VSSQYVTGNFPTADRDHIARNIAELSLTDLREAAGARRASPVITTTKQDGPGADVVRAEAKEKVQRYDHTGDEADRASR
jgi:hypothetical protein